MLDAAMDAAIRVLLHSAEGGAPRLSILIFHRVSAQADPLFPDVPDALRFEQQMRWMQRWFNVLPLFEAIGQLRQGSSPPRAAAITFDDGYADNAEVALPILSRLGLPATFFVSSGFLDGSCMWNDVVIEALRGCPKPRLNLEAIGAGHLELGATPAERRRAIESLLAAIKHRPFEERASCVQEILGAAGASIATGLMMKPEQVRQLALAGMEIGGHTVSHPILTRLAPAEAEREIAQGKKALESIIDRELRLFAYPNGVPAQDFAAEHAAMVQRAGFQAAVTTAWGAADASSDPYQLPRFTPWDLSELRFGLRLVGNLRRPVPQPLAA
jgi:peptidoglycan/xylan/chitin deacetylase (PgdA/CDA1 family)